MDYEIYEAWRRDNTPALKVFNKWKDLERRSKARRASTDVPSSLANALVAVFVGTIVSGLLKGLLGNGYPTLWIKSQTGKTTKELPLSLALRVARKRKWEFVEVEPKKSPRVISRRKALEILILGDIEYGWCRLPKRR